MLRQDPAGHLPDENNKGERPEGWERLGYPLMSGGASSVGASEGREGISQHSGRERETENDHSVISATFLSKRGHWRDWESSIFSPPSDYFWSIYNQCVPELRRHPVGF